LGYELKFYFNSFYNMVIYLALETVL